MSPKCNFHKLFVLIINILPHVFSLPDQGKWTLTINQDSNYLGVAKSLYKGSEVSISVACVPTNDNLASSTKIQIGWILRQTPCYEEYLAQSFTEAFRGYYHCPDLNLESYNSVRYLKSNISTEHCSHTIDLKAPTETFQVHGTTTPEKCVPNDGYLIIPSIIRKRNAAAKGNTPLPETLPEPLPQKFDLSVGDDEPQAVAQKPKEAQDKKDSSGKKAKQLDQTTDLHVKKVIIKEEKSVTTQLPIKLPQNSDPLVTIDQDGVYVLVIFVRVAGNESRNYTATFDIKLKGPHGYLSAVDWPLLPFYGVMCGIYVIYAIAWLAVSALQWRDLLRIQFWIGGVIFLGLFEKAVFYAEYQYINSTGQAGHAGMIFAEILSCFKRTLARLLVIIVSLGFGIVKPRLGPALHRVIGIGALYFTLCSVEGWLRVLKPKNDPSNQTLMAEIPLAVLDSGICWWIFSSLVQTTRTLRLRRNVVKLGLYRHFTNTLVFSVLASVIYMSWSLYNHKLTSCITDWKELWVDEAYWHFLFSLLLMVIMILWRPTNNNQRYAFTPLLDAMDEEEDLLEKESNAMNDIYGTKARGSKTQTATVKKEQKNGTQQDEDLKWVEENIPSSLSDTALPSLLDSDEEIMTVRFERNKME